MFLARVVFLLCANSCYVYILCISYVYIHHVYVQCTHVIVCSSRNQGRKTES